MPDARDELVYKGVIFDVYSRKVDLPRGGTAAYETVVCPDAVRVYPVTEDSRLLMISELRPDLEDRVLRVVSGRLEPGDSPHAAATRELREELGYTAGELETFATSTPMLKVRHTVHHVLARDLRQGGAQPEELEDVREHPVELEAIEGLAWSGSIREDVIALNLLRLGRRLGLEARA